MEILVPTSAPIHPKHHKEPNLFWSRYISVGADNREEFDLRRFFDDAEYVAIKVACFLALLIVLSGIVRGHFK